MVAEAGTEDHAQLGVDQNRSIAWPCSRLRFGHAHDGEAVQVVVDKTERQCRGRAQPGMRIAL
jgi:hypothetical protein